MQRSGYDGRSDLAWSRLANWWPEEKLLAALRGVYSCGPLENEKDLADVLDNIKEGLEIIPVENMDQVLEHALQKMPIEIEWMRKPIMPKIWAVIMAATSHNH